MNRTETLPDLFFRNLEKSPQGLAVGNIIDDHVGSLSYKKLFGEVSIIGNGINSLLSPENNHVGILGDTSLRWHLIDLSCLLLGACVVPIYPTLSIEEQLFIIEHSDITTLFIENSYYLNNISKIKNKFTKLKNIVIYSTSNSKVDNIENIKVINWKDFYREGESLEVETPDLLKSKRSLITPSTIASIIYTSGTTGRPKGAILTHGNFYNMLKGIEIFLHHNINQNDRSLIVLPLSHVLGRCDSLLYLVLKHEAIFSRITNNLAAELKLIKPTLFIAVPRIFEKIYETIQNKIKTGDIIDRAIYNKAEKISQKYFNKIDADLSPNPLEIIQRELSYKFIFSKIKDEFGEDIRFLVTGGASLRPQIINFFRYCNLTLLEGYGLTETCGPCTLNPISKQVTGTVGIPIYKTEISFSEESEILIKSPALFSAYYKEEDLSENAFDNGFFKTGDIGKLTQAGFLQITDRLKNLIITSYGKNISPVKIENLIKSSHFISNAVVFGEGKKYLVAIIGLNPEAIRELHKKYDLKIDSDFLTMAQSEGVRKQISREILEINQKLARFEQIKGVFISPLEFNQENGLLTPSAKEKREVIYNKFQSQIDAMYQE